MQKAIEKNNRLKQVVVNLYIKNNHIKKLDAENKKLDIMIDEREDEYLQAKHKSNLLAEKLKIASSYGKFNYFTRNDIC